MAKDGNINDNGPIQSGRKKEDAKKYVDNLQRIFGKKKDKSKDDKTTN